VERVHHETTRLRLDGYQLLAAVQRTLAYARLAGHALTHDSEGLGDNPTIRG
jgi:hypothetical protein